MYSLWRCRLSTYPLLVGKWSPLGIITASEALGIAVFLLIATYHVGRSTQLTFRGVDRTNQARSIKYNNTNKDMILQLDDLYCVDRSI
jgi:hypothetical protein